MENGKEIRRTRKLVKQSIFLHSMRKYHLRDVVKVLILDESIEKYLSEKGNLMKRRLIANMKYGMDKDIMLSMLPDIRMNSDEELHKIANMVYATVKAYNAKKDELIQEALAKNDKKEANNIAKKNNAYINLCETISGIIIERVQDKGQLSFLKGFSTGVLKFVLKDVVYKKVKNEISCSLNTDYEPKNEYGLKKDAEWQQIIDEIEKILTARNYDLSNNKLPGYIQQIRDDEQYKFDHIDD